MKLGIGVIGSGTVGRTLAAGYAAEGHEVVVGTREAAKLAEWAAAHAGVTVGTVADAADQPVVILAVAGHAAVAAIQLAGVERLAGKVVIDTCNPISGPPVAGVLPYFTGPNDSLIQRLQAAAPDARFVKAFSSVGSAFMIHPKLTGGRPTMFICGDDASAKELVTGLLHHVGWDVADVGPAAMGGPVEALCQLWCAPGFLHNDWAHAFAFLRP